MYKVALTQNTEADVVVIYGRVTTYILEYKNKSLLLLLDYLTLITLIKAYPLILLYKNRRHFSFRFLKEKENGGS